MANGQSQYATAIAAASRSRVSGVNQSTRLRTKGVITDLVTILGNEGVGEFHDLGLVGVECEIIPEECRFRYAGSGTLSASAKIQRVYGRAYPLNVTWSRSTTTATVTTPVKHGYVTGQILAVTVTSSAAAIALGNVTITVTGDFTYTFTCLNAGDASGTLTIGPAAGSVSDVVAAVTFDASGVEVGTPPANTWRFPLNSDDRLRLTFTAVTTVTAGRIIDLELGILERTYP